MQSKSNVAKSTVQTILDRHPGLLRPTSERPMTKARNDPINITNAEAFLTVWQRNLEWYAVSSDHIINADESLLRVHKDGTEAVRYEARYKSGGSECEISKKAIGSICPFVSAAGTVWLVVFCFKIPKKKDDRPFTIYVPADTKSKRSENSPLGYLVFGTSSGLLNADLWDCAINKLIEIIHVCSATPDKEIILVTDNLGIHQQVASIKAALEKGLYQIFFPPNCSHWIQPLDHLLFAALQQAVRKLCSVKFVDASFWGNRKDDLQKLVLEACLEVFP